MESAFAGADSREAVIYMIRNTQQELVALSGQADLKAGILITACSVVLTIGTAQAADSRFSWGVGALAVFLLPSLLGAVLCVIPSVGLGRRPTGAAEPRPNLLFFGDFTLLEESEFVSRLGALSRDEGGVYESQARDLYRHGA